MIDSLVTNFHFEFRSWSSFYGHGVWVALLPVRSFFEGTNYATSAGDADMFPSVEYITSVDWLPIVLADDFTSAMNELETKLLELNLRSGDNYCAWLEAVNEALEHYVSVIEMNDYGSLPVLLKPLSSDYRAIWVE
ncbi:conserved hypothetical protein [Vibrio chagasii]|nr:conserved hypothetical protein [Vibrio chagasii]